MQYKPMTIHAVAATYDVHDAVCTTGCLKRKNDSEMNIAFRNAHSNSK
jgi:hypothetical protein